MSLFLHKINITQFRNYEALRLNTGGAPVVVLAGENGAGKTNILEAISLLAPGKGLRSADFLEMRNRNAAAGDAWAVSAEIGTVQDLRIRIGTGLDLQKKRRVIRLNGKEEKKQAVLAELVSVVWLTPQMDRLFLEGSSARRKFLDRLVYAFDPAHVTRLNRYDRCLRERLALLTADRPADRKWLDELESQLAANAVPIAASRRLLTEKLQATADILRSSAPLFPGLAITARGETEEKIGLVPALLLEEELKEKFKAQRTQDGALHRTHSGVHRCDMDVFYEDKRMPAAQCSTGEQKALLFSIVMAHAMMMRAERGFTPLLLLDEVAAHLDEARRAQLFSLFSSFNGQIWLTGTESSIFAPLKNKAAVFSVQAARVAPEKILEAVS